MLKRQLEQEYLARGRKIRELETSLSLTLDKLVELGKQRDNALKVRDTERQKCEDWQKRFDALLFHGYKPRAEAGKDTP